MDEAILPVESIQERDIDLLLLEEFATDTLFCNWIVRTLDLPELTIVNGAWRSITAFGLGETDILFSYMSKKRKVFLLIENKLDASFQDKQFSRYTERAKIYKDKGECDIALAILIAPEVYCRNQDYFDISISYEGLAKRFDFIGSKRSLFKSGLLKIASEKLRRGYTPVNSEPVQQFWKSYWEYKEEHYSDFVMKKPDIVPYNSDWPMLYIDGLKNIVFFHKLGQGNVDATFSKVSDEVELQIRDTMPEWAEYIKHSKSFSIRVFSGKVNRLKEFNSQIENVDKGLKNLVRIKEWLIENLECFF